MKQLKKRVSRLQKMWDEEIGLDGPDFTVLLLGQAILDLNQKLDSIQKELGRLSVKP